MATFGSGAGGGYGSLVEVKHIDVVRSYTTGSAAEVLYTVPANKIAVIFINESEFTGIKATSPIPVSYYSYMRSLSDNGINRTYQGPQNTTVGTNTYRELVFVLGEGDVFQVGRSVTNPPPTGSFSARIHATIRIYNAPNYSEIV